MWHIRLFQGCDFLRGKFQRHCRNCIFEMIWFRGTDDRRGNSRFVEQPCQRDLGTLDIFGLGDFADPLNHFAVGIFCLAIE